jgi:membrane-associated protease RseP (regulator of RpoE activity)
MSILFKRPLGNAAAVWFPLIALGAPMAASLGAQAGTITQSAATVRIHVVNRNQAQLDTLHALMRQLEQLTPGSPAHEVLMRQIDGLLPSVVGNSVVLRSTAPRLGMPSKIAMPTGWIGINVQGLSVEMIENNRLSVAYFDHPSIAAVDPDSPAQHAGIARGDVLIAYNGNDVVGHQFDLTDLLVPDKKIAVTVQRDGDTKVFDVTVAKAPARIDIRRRDLGAGAPNEVYFKRIISGDDDEPRVPIMALPRGAFIGPRITNIPVTPNGALGAIMSTVNQELARTLKLEAGVLVNDVVDGSPAAKSGLRAGDVVVDVDGHSVTTLHGLQEQILRGSNPVTLHVVRDKKLRAITVSW